MTSLGATVRALAGRECRRFYRQRGRLSGAVGTPVLFWLLLGSGFRGSFRFAEPGGESYLLYFYPGMIVLTIVFTAVFSTIGVIDDRRDGFLAAALVAPAPRAGVAAGLVAGGALIATLQSALLLAPARWIGCEGGPPGLAAALCVCGLLAVGCGSLGLAVAWRMDSAQGYHAFMNLVLVPLWLLSGAVFPPAQSSPWLRTVMALNPLSYGVAALTGYLHGTAAPWRPALVTAGCAVGAFAWACRRVAAAESR